MAYSCAAPTAFGNGDAAVYAQQMADRDFGIRTVHLGYVVAGTAWSDVTGGVSAAGLNRWAGWIVGTTLASIGWMLRTFDVDWTRVLAVLLLLGVAPATLAEATFAEVDALMAMGLVASGLALRTGHVHLGGAVFGLAAWSSPVAWVYLPVAAAWTAFHAGPFQRRDVARFVGSSALAFAPLLWTSFGDWWSGPRGIVAALAERPIGPGATLERQWTEALGTLGVAFPVCAIGFWRMDRLWLAGGLGTWLVAWLVVDRFGDVPVLWPLWLLGGAIAMAQTLLRWVPTPRRAGGLFALALGLQTFLGVHDTTQQRRSAQAWRRATVEVAEAMPNNTWMVADSWSKSRTATWYTRRRSGSVRWSSQAELAGDADAWRRHVRRGDPIWMESRRLDAAYQLSALGYELTPLARGWSATR